jgi:hypothetical protein
MVFAAPVSVQDAEKIATAWMQQKTHKKYTTKTKLYSTSSASLSGKTKNYKIVLLEPQGWVIVSLDNVTRPILAYGTSKWSSKMPPALKGLLGQYDRYIDREKKRFNSQPNLRWLPQWHRLKQSDSESQNSSDQKLYASSNDDSSENKLYSSGDSDYDVRPLLWLGGTDDTEDQGIRWDQGEYYNAYTPTDENGDHTPTGCVATAMGQIMRYWKYPNHGIGEHSYTPETHPEYGEQSANFGETYYDWENMPLTLTSENDAVAQALYHAGVSVDMDYAPEGSGAWYGDSLKKYFGYKMHLYGSGKMFTHENMHMVIDNGIPLLVAGWKSDGGHAYILDGYDDDGYYHANLGWGGHSNGKYLIDDVVDYNTTVFLAVAPEDPSDQIDIADEHFADCLVDQLSLSSRDDIRELTLEFFDSYLDCEGQEIESVDEVSYLKNAKGIYLDDNNVSGDLNLTGNKALGYFTAGNNQLSGLDFSGLENLRYISVYGNKLQKLILPNQGRLEYFDADDNNLTGTLDLSGEGNLTVLSVLLNQLQEIILPNQGRLEYFDADDNNLTGTLDLSGEGNLTSIYVYSNKLTKIILPEDGKIETLDIGLNPDLNISQIENLKNIEYVWAYGTKLLLCSTVDTIKADNNITNLYISCNHSPAATDDNESTPINTQITISVLSNDSDPDGDALSIALQNQPSHGSITVSDNKVIYTPEDDYVGEDTFTYKAQDEHGALSNEATVSITVRNQAPEANDDTASTLQNTSVTISVLSNDSDPDGDALGIVAEEDMPLHGTVYNSNDKVIYTPKSNYVGTDTFTYRVQDEHGAWSNAATVSITVYPNDSGDEGNNDDTSNGDDSDKGGDTNNGNGGGGAMGYLLPFLIFLLGWYRRED